MTATTWTLAVTLTLCHAGPPAARPAEEKGGPKLLSKGKDFLLHALPPEPAQPAWLRPSFGGRWAGAYPRGLVLLHTSTATGKMKFLAAGGTTVIPFGGERSSSSGMTWTTRIAGVAADKERLYVLLWKDYTPRKYHLEVFRPADGVLVRSLVLKGDDLPKDQPRETSDKGPLQLLPDGVSCFGRKFEFKGGRLSKPPPEKKP